MDYILIQDNDCHWYVIPVDKKNEWFKWEESDDYELGVIPDWAKEVNGSPTLVKFKEYRIE